MRDDDFDLDVRPEHPVDNRVIDALGPEMLEQAIAALPADLHAGMMGVLLDHRTYSDVSQELGIRQAELVRMIQRGRAIIARHLGA